MTIAPMAVNGVHHLIERAYRESGELQYLRELTVNAVEAGATRIEFGPEWGAVERDGVYRLCVADNGRGMSPDQLLGFLNTFGGGGKPIGGAHENFGVGAKTSLLPWNQAGVVVCSWTEEHPHGGMVWLMRDAETGEYGAKKFDTESGFHEVVEPFGAWRDVRPDWLVHGTVVVCLGNTGTENTYAGKDGRGDIKGIASYLNKRMWALKGVYVQEFRSGQWPRSLKEARGVSERRYNRRELPGAGYFVSAPSSGELALHDGTVLEWYFSGAERPKVHSYAHARGYIAARYRDELYDTQQHPSQYRTFGITQQAVREALTIIARPSADVYPDTARNALKIAGEALPWAEWASEFAGRLPQPIADALMAATPKGRGTLDDPAWRQRLSERFSARWATLRYVPEPDSSSKASITEPSHGGGERVEADSSGSGSARAPRSGPHPGAVHEAPTSASALGGEAPVRAVRASGGVPDYEWLTLKEINGSDARQYAAVWTPPSTVRPSGLVQIARDFPALLEVRKWWCDQYPDHLAPKIIEVIERTYGQVLVARIAHSELLVRDASWGYAAVQAELRSPAALTASVLGLLAEDAVISSALAGLGVRRRQP